MTPVMIYLMTVIGHFAASALLHLPDWSDELMVYPQAFDHIMIFSKLAATYYVAIRTILYDVDPVVKYVLMVGISLGVMLRILWTQAPNIIIGLPYVIVGWAPILDLEGLSRAGNRVGNGSYLAVIAGLVYTTGAMMYITRRPRPCDKYMGYHELFHVCTIIGAILFSICVFAYAIPYHEARQQIKH
jgi:hemolysin III